MLPMQCMDTWEQVIIINYIWCITPRSRVSVSHWICQSTSYATQPVTDLNDTLISVFNKATVSLQSIGNTVRDTWMFAWTKTFLALFLWSLSSGIILVVLWNWSKLKLIETFPLWKETMHDIMSTDDLIMPV